MARSVDNLVFKCSYSGEMRDKLKPTNNDNNCINSKPNECISSSVSVAFYDKVMWEKIQANKKLPVIHPTSCSYEEFFTKYLINNVPCMFSGDITESWLSRKNWVTSDENEDTQEKLNLEYLLKVYGDAEVSVVNCNDAEYKSGYGTRDCRIMLFSDYVKLWREEEILSSESCSPCLYLKDWHIVRFHQATLSGSELPYKVPIFFQPDWLNEVCQDANADDFKFCYMGPKGSFTSFHADVYGSYSWSANIYGVKRWYLYPPGKESRFLNSKTNKIKFNWDDPGVPGEDFIEVIQNAGECLFVPSGWHHVVWNLTDAVSINHNWYNGANICYIWKILQDALKEVENELDDLREIPEFHEQCQLILKVNHGMNYEGFFEILESIIKARKNHLSSSPHTDFDLKAINHVVHEHCLKDPIVKMHFYEHISGSLTIG